MEPWISIGPAIIAPNVAMQSQLFLAALALGVASNSSGMLTSLIFFDNLRFWADDGTILDEDEEEAEAPAATITSSPRGSGL